MTKLSEDGKRSIEEIFILFFFFKGERFQPGFTGGLFQLKGSSSSPPSPSACSLETFLL